MRAPQPLRLAAAAEPDSFGNHIGQVAVKPVLYLLYFFCLFARETAAQVLLYHPDTVTEYLLGEKSKQSRERIMQLQRQQGQK